MVESEAASERGERMATIAFFENRIGLVEPMPHSGTCTSFLREIHDGFLSRYRPRKGFTKEKGFL